MANGSVISYRRKDGVVVRRIKFRDASGRQVMQTIGAVSVRDAKRELRDRLSRVDKGYVRPEPLTFGEYAAGWFRDGPAKRGWKPRTVAIYVSVERRLVEYFGRMQLAEIRPRHIAAYVSEHPHGASTVGRDLSVLTAIFKTALRSELVTANPADGAERPKLPPFRPEILEPVEVARVAKAFHDEQARVAFLTLVLTAVRRSELQVLRWRDVDLVENVLRVRDSKSEDGRRSIALSPTLAEELWQHRRRSGFQGDDELVFCHPERGTTYNADHFKEALTAALTAAGVEKRPRAFHDLRHTAITNDAAAGSSAIAVMTKAGHASMSTTKRYLHLAGVVFADEAAALERRLGLSTEPSTRLSEPEPISAERASLNGAESALSGAA
jgi:integrase